MNKKLSFIISLVVGALATFIVVSYVKSVTSQMEAELEPVKVLVARTDIPKLAIIEETMVELAEVPKKYVQPAALKSMEEIRGKIAEAPILQGEVITNTKIVIPNRKTGLAQQIEAGRRAITIAISDVTGVAGLVKPFDHVDVLVITNHGDDEKQDKIISTLYQDLLILATGKNLGAGVPSATEKDETTDALKFVDMEDQKYLNVTLSVSPQQAMGLVLAQSFGELYLSLRPAYNSKNVDLMPMNIENVINMKKSVTSIATRPSWMTLRSNSVNF